MNSFWCYTVGPYISMYMGFLGGSSDKESTCNAAVAGDLGLIPGLGSPPGRGHGKPASILAWKISRTKEPGGLQSIGLQSRTWPKRQNNHAHTMCLINPKLLIYPRPSNQSYFFLEEFLKFDVLEIAFLFWFLDDQAQRIAKMLLNTFLSYIC